MLRMPPFLAFSTMILTFACTTVSPHKDDAPNLSTAPDPEPDQKVIQGTWALPIRNVQKPMEQVGDQILVRLTVEEFIKAEFDRAGFWDESGFYEHAYGGNHSGSFTYLFPAPRSRPKELTIKARLSAESSAKGAADETSEVNLLLNGQSLGRQEVVPDDGIGRVYTWRISDPKQIAALQLKQESNNTLQFVVPASARKKNGLCIYGRALEEKAPEPGDAPTLTFHLDPSQPAATERNPL